MAEGFGRREKSRLIFKRKSDGILPDVNECEVGKPANRLRFNNTEAELKSCTARPVYDAALWRAVKSEQTGNVVAIGIAERIVRLVRVY